MGEQGKAAIEAGKYGAVVCNDKIEKFGYYIVEWASVPWTDQKTHELLCDAFYWNSVQRAPGWYTRSSPPHIEIHLLNHVITADLPLHKISENHTLPNGCAKASAAKKGARKLSDESHDSILLWQKFSKEKLLKTFIERMKQKLQLIMIQVVVAMVVAVV